jgi:hypothetical protein
MPRVQKKGFGATSETVSPIPPRNQRELSREACAESKRAERPSSVSAPRAALGHADRQECRSAPTLVDAARATNRRDDRKSGRRLVRAVPHSALPVPQSDPLPRRPRSPPGTSRKLRQVAVGNQSRPRPRLYGGPVASVNALDEAVLSRLRRAITAQAGGEEEQLNGVLRMLGAEIPAETQVPLFGQGPAGQAPKALRRP